MRLHVVMRMHAVTILRIWTSACTGGQIEMACVRNATHTLTPEEQDAVEIMHAPCKELQDLMSESEDSIDTKDLLVRRCEKCI